MPNPSKFQPSAGEKEDSQLQPSLAMLAYFRREEKQNLSNLWSSQTRSTGSLKNKDLITRPQHVAPPYHIPSGQLTTDPFTKYIMSNYQEECKGNER